MPHTHTDEQLEILSAASTTDANLMLSALAGCGKSSTLLMIERAVTSRPMPILYLVFNVDNAEKIMSAGQMTKERRKPRPGHSTDPRDRVQSLTTVRTLNSMGHRIWGQGRGLTLNKDKTRDLFKLIIEGSPKTHRDAIWESYSEVLQGVSLAKALGYVPDGVYPNAKRLCTQNELYDALDEVPDDLTVELIDAILTRSIKLSYDGIIDYNDQVYMPALFGGAFPRYPLVLVDEYQDLSPVNHALLQRLVKGRLIGVGDPNQNIYGFRGAKADGMRDAIAQYVCNELPLSMSFRCPSEIVKHVHWHVPSFRASKNGGSVDFPDRLRGCDIREHSTVICRNNAPILKMAFNLLSIGRSVTVAGGDIGPRLMGIMRKLGSDDLSGHLLMVAIDIWKQAKLAKDSKSAEDIAACMHIFADYGKTLGGAIAYAKSIFAQEGTTYLTTGHKAKGLEWEDVYHLDPYLVRRNQNRQNKNLDYVISTRSFDRLTEIDSENIEW